MEVRQRGLPAALRCPLDAEFLVQAGFRLQVRIAAHVAAGAQARQCIRAAIATGVIQIVRIRLVQVRRLERPGDAALHHPVAVDAELRVEAGAGVVAELAVVVEAQARGNDPALTQVDVVFDEHGGGLRIGLAPRTIARQPRDAAAAAAGLAHRVRVGQAAVQVFKAKRPDVLGTTQRGREAHFAVQLVVAQSRGRPVGAVEAAFRATGQAFVDA